MPPACRIAVVQLDLPVVRLDLGGQRVEAEVERLDELARHRRPVDIAARRRGAPTRFRSHPRTSRGNRMPRPAPRCAPGATRRRRAPCPSSWASRAVRACARASRHPDAPPTSGAQRRDDRAELGQPHLFDRALDGQGVGGRVDVLARAREVRELGDAVEAELREPVAHEVLDGLDVVPRDRLALGEPGDLVLAEVEEERRGGGPCRSRSGAAVPNSERSVRAMSHSTSTSTRARLSPASER